jgi:hypothetical protein
MINDKLVTVYCEEEQMIRKLELMSVRGTTWGGGELFCFLKSASSEADLCP